MELNSNFLFNKLVRFNLFDISNFNIKYYIYSLKIYSYFFYINIPIGLFDYLKLPLKGLNQFFSFLFVFTFDFFYFYNSILVYYNNLFFFKEFFNSLLIFKEIYFYFFFTKLLYLNNFIFIFFNIKINYIIIFIEFIFSYLYYFSELIFFKYYKLDYILDLKFFNYN